jgi:hypothetical protein
VANVGWLASKAEAVPSVLSEARAGICVQCPLNTKGDWLSLFTVPWATAIRSALNTRREMQLSTSHDGELGVCEACDCPLALKVHFDLKRILDHMPSESFDALDKGCWIRSEKAQFIDP